MNRDNFLKSIIYLASSFLLINFLTTFVALLLGWILEMDISIDFLIVIPNMVAGCATAFIVFYIIANRSQFYSQEGIKVNKDKICISVLYVVSAILLLYLFVAILAFVINIIMTDGSAMQLPKTIKKIIGLFVFLSVILFFLHRAKDRNKQFPITVPDSAPKDPPPKK